jgi:hypothetical protein
MDRGHHQHHHYDRSSADEEDEADDDGGACCLSSANALESLEQKLRHYEQNIFSMKEFIETKMRETDFQGQ